MKINLMMQENKDQKDNILTANITEDGIVKKRDCWSNATYEDSRYLDAVASWLNVWNKGICAAVIYTDNKIYCSYNKSFNKDHEILKKKILFLGDFLYQSAQKSDSEIFNTKIMLGLYCTLNQDFKKCVGNLKKNYSDYIKDFAILTSMANKSINKYIKDSKNQNNISDFIENFTRVTNEYKKIIFNAKNNGISQDLQFHVFFRPMQDVYKLHKFIATEKEKQIFTENYLVLLANPNGLHAEYNIARHFPFTDLLGNNYIGISKLSCGYCHKALNDTNHIHRGTHGKCDEWTIKSPKHFVQFKCFKTKVKEKDTKLISSNQANPPDQYRDLSCDEIEKKINIDYVDEKEHNQNSTLYFFKKKLDLLPTITDTNDSINITIESHNIDVVGSVCETCNCVMS